MSDTKAKEPDRTRADLEELVDKRVDSALARLELTLRTEVDSRMDDRFDKDRAFLTGSVGTATKIIGWGLGFLAVILTLFGIKTFADIHTTANKLAVAEVKRALAFDDPDSRFNRTVEELLDRAIMDSYLLAIARTKSDPHGWARDLEIAEADISRLLDLIGRPEASEKDFRDALDILNRVRDDRLAEKIDKSISELLVAESPAFEWIRGQSGKRAILLTNYDDDGSQPLARAILSDAESPEELLLAAVSYCSRTNDVESVKSLEGLYSRTNDSDQKPRILKAIAKLDPRSEVMNAWLAQLCKGVSEDRDWVEALRIVPDLLEGSGRSFIRKDPLEGTRKKVALAIISGAVDHDASFLLIDDPGTHVWQLYVAFHARMGTRYSVSSDLIFGDGSDIVQSIFRGAAERNDMPRVARLVRAFSLRDDDRALGVVRCILVDNASLELYGATMLDKTSAPNGVGIRGASGAEDNTLLATWFDASGLKRTGKLKQFRGGDGLIFDVSTEMEISDDEDL